MNLKSRLIVGFGVSDKKSFEAVTRHTNGAIVGSAFVRALQTVPTTSGRSTSDVVALQDTIKGFVEQFS
jgi:tryptophan synthase alpha subunit